MILLCLVGLILALLLAAVIRALLIPSKKSTYTPAPDEKRALAVPGGLKFYKYLAVSYKA